MKYRTKSVEVDAVQWQENLQWSDQPDWLAFAATREKIVSNSNYHQVRTSDGSLATAWPTDWIVRDADVNLAVYKNYDFVRQYEQL